MIHYHGTPVGGTREGAIRFLRGRHALVPHFYQADMAAVAEACASFILDNSAYTVMNSGGELDVPGYIVWVEEWHRHPGFDWALIPDAIGGDDAENDALLRDWPAHLRHCGVPVWHLHEDVGRLHRLVREYPTVALGTACACSTSRCLRNSRCAEPIARMPPSIAAAFRGSEIICRRQQRNGPP